MLCFTLSGPAVYVKVPAYDEHSGITSGNFATFFAVFTIFHPAILALVDS